MMGAALVLPGVILVLIDIDRRGWCKAIYGIAGVAAFLRSFIALLPTAAYRSLVGPCENLRKAKLAECDMMIKAEEDAAALGR